MKSRRELLQYFAQQGFTKGAEIGVFDGKFSVAMFDTIPGLRLYCVDPWATPRAQAVKSKAYAALEPRGAILMPVSSLSAATRIEDGFFDFVYIDAAHDYDSVAADLRAWTPKVRVSGIVAGHDYYVFPNTKNDGVIRAVDDFVLEHDLDLHLTDWNKSDPVADERQPSWWFVRP